MILVVEVMESQASTQVSKRELKWGSMRAQIITYPKAVQVYYREGDWPLYDMYCRISPATEKWICDLTEWQSVTQKRTIGLKVEVSKEFIDKILNAKDVSDVKKLVNELAWKATYERALFKEEESTINSMIGELWYYLKSFLAYRQAIIRSAEYKEAIERYIDSLIKSYIEQGG